jgi:hypothetical protein
LFKNGVSDSFKYSDEKIFSKTSFDDFSYFVYVPTKDEKVPLIPYINYKKFPPPSIVDD